MPSKGSFWAGLITDTEEAQFKRRYYKQFKPETIYISHGANGNWFIVEPRDHPDDQVESLANAGSRGRTVYRLEAKPWKGGRIRTLKTVLWRKIKRKETT